MEILGLPFTQFFIGLLSIVMIDLVLGGDNAIVIGLACRNLPKNLQLKAIILGTAGAIVIRIAATLVVVWLLKIKGLMLGGGLLLIWIAYKLLAKPAEEDAVKSQDSLLAAIMTIIIADAAMGIDNVLAIAGASHGSYMMIIIGLLISIPIMVFGSTILIKLMDKFPLVIDLGAAIIAYTAGKMIMEEPLLAGLVNPWMKFLFMALVVVSVLFLGRRKRAALTPISE